MKKSTRFFVVGGLLSILAGGIIMLVTGCIGGISMMHTIATEYTYSGWNFGHGYWSFGYHGVEHYDDYFDDDHFGGNHHDGTHHDSITENGSVNLDEIEDDIHSLLIYGIDGVDLDIIQENSQDVKLLSVQGVGIEYVVDGGRLVIRSKYGNGLFSEGGKIVLSVPEDMYWEDVDIEFDAGELDMEGIHARKIALKVGAGEASVDRIEAEKMEISVGAGEVKAEKMEISGDAVISVGLGNVEISGVVDGSMDFSCGMGNIEFEGKNSAYDDYNYDISCAAGNVEIDHSRFSGFAFDRQIDNHSHKDMNIDCGMGNVSVSFDMAGYDD